MTAPERVMVYVDGYNVYYGFKRKGWRPFLWLDYRAVFETIRGEHQQIEDVKYITAMAHDPGSLKRQRVYLEALTIHGGVSIILGNHVTRRVKCVHCGERWKRQQEKESDVHMAVQMMLDAVSGEIDTMWVVTRDSDLVPAVKAVHDMGIKVVIMPPPDGSESPSGGADALTAAAGGNKYYVQPRHWKRCQLPDELQREKGSPRAKRPPEWR